MGWGEVGAGKTHPPLNLSPGWWQPNCSDAIPGYGLRSPTNRAPCRTHGTRCCSITNTTTTKTQMMKKRGGDAVMRKEGRGEKSVAENRGFTIARLLAS